jgi:hypothetical protein
VTEQGKQHGKHAYLKNKFSLYSLILKEGNINNQSTNRKPQDKKLRKGTKREKTSNDCVVCVMCVHDIDIHVCHFIFHNNFEL